MDFEPAYTPEQEAFRKEVRSWLAEHVPVVDGNPDSDENYPKYREFGRKLGARGWLRSTAPVEYGGGGLSVDHAIVIGEEIDAYDLGLPPYYDTGGTLGGASILVWGTEEQKLRMLPPIFRGEVVTWQLLTGPEAGSDLAGTQTEAVRDGDDYVINGEKVFVGGTHGADYLWTITRTDPDGERHHNLSWFMIPADVPGITVTPMELMGDDGEGAGRGHKNTIFFDDVRVPAANLVGGENNGWKVATTHLELEHGSGGRSKKNHVNHFRKSGGGRTSGGRRTFESGKTGRIRRPQRSLFIGSHQPQSDHRAARRYRNCELGSSVRVQPRADRKASLGGSA